MKNRLLNFELDMIETTYARTYTQNRCIKSLRLAFPLCSHALIALNGCDGGDGVVVAYDDDNNL